MNKQKMSIQIQTEIVRNSLFYLNNGEFLLYARLLFLWFRNYKDNNIPIDHKKLMVNLEVTDTRTLRKRINKLYELGLINNNIERFPNRGEIIIQFNDNPFESKHFTMIPATIFNYIGRIDEHCFRLLFYYKSYINYDKNKDFCFVGVRKICEDLKMSRSTLINCNNILVKNKLLKIEKHKLESLYEYGVNDELIYDKYNNHYYVEEENF